MKTPRFRRSFNHPCHYSTHAICLTTLRTTLLIATRWEASGLRTQVRLLVVWRSGSVVRRVLRCARLLTGHNQLKSKNRPISFVTCHSETDCNINSDFKILNKINFSTWCIILVTVGPVTPEIARATTAPCWTRQQKSAYPTEYLSNY